MWACWCYHAAQSDYVHFVTQIKLSNTASGYNLLDACIKSAQEWILWKYKASQVWMDWGICTYMHVFVSTCTYTCVYVCICMYMRVYVCICVYMHVYVRIISGITSGGSPMGARIASCAERGPSSSKPGESCFAVQPFRVWAVFTSHNLCSAQWWRARRQNFGVGNKS